MLSPPTQPQIHSRRRLRTSLVALLTLVAVALMAGSHGVPSAEAAVFDASGYPGTASFPKPYAAKMDGYNSILPGRYYVTRSAAYAGTQYAKVTLRMWGFNAELQRWVFDRQYSSSVYLGAGQSGYVDFNWMNPFYRNVHIDVIVTWYNTATWQAIGVRHADCVNVDDYRVGYGAQVYANTYVGAYVHFL